VKTLTVNELIAAYTTDPISPYRKLRHRTRVNYDGLMRRIAKDHGGKNLSELKYRTFHEWHKEWTPSGVPMAHSLMGMVRTLISFGMAFLEDTDCERLVPVLHKLRLPMGGHREQVLTVQQIIAIRALAHQRGLHMIALAQAIQFENTWRQKDVIGEWCPMSEPGVSEITWARYDEKWLRGVRWSEIDERMILTHITSKKLKKDVVDLTAAPMIIEELEIAFCDLGETLTRAKLPPSGPVIVDPDTGRPYRPHKFRKLWRALARACGVPDDVQQRDTRATAITEAINSGVSLEDARKAAKHSQSQQTAAYSREDEKAKKRSMQQRAASRVA